MCTCHIPTIDFCPLSWSSSFARYAARISRAPLAAGTPIIGRTTGPLFHPAADKHCAPALAVASTTASPAPAAIVNPIVFISSLL
jgi:hypothetical protein